MPQYDNKNRRIIFTINPHDTAGTDYTSLASFLADSNISKNLVAIGSGYTVKCIHHEDNINSVEQGHFLFQDWITNENYDLIITADRFSFDGTYNSTHYTFSNIQPSSIFTIKNSNIHVNGLQFHYNTSSVNNLSPERALILIDAQPQTTIDNIQISNNFFNNNGLRQLNSITLLGSGSQTFIYNNSFQNLGSGHAYNIFVMNAYASGAAINNTFVKSNREDNATIRSNCGRFILYNNLLWEGTTANGLIVSGVFSLSSAGNITTNITQNVFPTVSISGFNANGVVIDTFKRNEAYPALVRYNRYLAQSGVNINNIWGLHSNYFNKDLAGHNITSRSHIGAHKSSTILQKVRNNQPFNDGTRIMQIGPSGAKVVDRVLDISYIDFTTNKWTDRFLE